MVSACFVSHSILMLYLCPILYQLGLQYHCPVYLLHLTLLILCSYYIMEEIFNVCLVFVEDNYYLEKCQLVEVEDKDYKIDVYYQIGFSFQYQSTSTTVS